MVSASIYESTKSDIPIDTDMATSLFCKINGQFFLTGHRNIIAVSVTIICKPLATASTFHDQFVWKIARMIDLKNCKQSTVCVAVLSELIMSVYIREDIIWLMGVIIYHITITYNGLKSHENEWMYVRCKSISNIVQNHFDFHFHEWIKDLSITQTFFHRQWRLVDNKITFDDVHCQIIDVIKSNWDRNMCL